MPVAQLDVDFFDRALVADPFPVYEAIRAAGRVVWNGMLKAWMVPGYEECLEVLFDPSGARFIPLGARHPEVTFWFDAPSMAMSTEPDHSRLRSGLARYFTPAAVQRTWEPRIQAVVEDALYPLIETRESVDLFDDFTRVSGTIAAEMLGVPAEYHEDIRRWSSAVITNLSFGHESPEQLRVMADAVGKLNEYLDAEIERHRCYELNDLLTTMITLSDWTEAEIRSSAVNLLLAGAGTTSKLMGECLVALEKHPDQRRLVADEPGLLPNAIEEVLRGYGPTQAIVRLAAEDTVLAGIEVREGDTVYAMLIAANRDPRRWSDPGRWDILRRFQPHLGFGVGSHFCVGASLARLETRVALETLLRLAPEYRLRNVDYGDAFFARGPNSGVIDVGAATPA